MINAEASTTAHAHWIVFDGDVDPDWVETLNSLLDDNKLLSLPSGERLALPENVRILFEVDSLRSATPATVSRCGMVWFSERTVTVAMRLNQALRSLASTPLVVHGDVADVLKTQQKFADVLSQHFAAGGLVEQALALDVLKSRFAHVMPNAHISTLDTFVSILRDSLQELIEVDPRAESLGSAAFVDVRILSSAIYEKLTVP